MQELQIYTKQDAFIKEILWNNEEIKADVWQKMKDYAAIVYTEDQIKEAKADRAKLNKYLTKLETVRKEVKKLCLTPYEDFEAKMKEITTLVSSTIKSIDSQVKEYEDQAKAEKKQAIVDYFNSLPKIEGFEALELPLIWNEKWLNATVSLKKAEEEISNILGEIKGNIEMLGNIPNYGFEAVAIYKTTLDPKRAVAEAQRHYEIQKEKEALLAKQAEEAARRQAETEARMAEKVAVEVPAIEIEEPQITEAEPAAEQAREWISFRAHLTVEDAKALKAFFESRNIEFNAI